MSLIKSSICNILISIRESLIVFILDYISLNNFPYKRNAETGLETIIFNLLRIDRNIETIIGEASVSISQLADQVQRDMILTLKNSMQSVLNIRITVGLQWLHSKSQYYEGLIKQLDEEINMLQKDKIEFAADLEYLLKPFKVFNNNLSGIILCLIDFKLCKIL